MKTIRSSGLLTAVLATGLAWVVACGPAPEEDERDWSGGSSSGDPAADAGTSGGDGGGPRPVDPTCVPLPCTALGPGLHADDGCGATIDCGETPCTDAKEGNDTLQTASDIGDMTDNPDSSRLYADLTLDDGDEDWFRANVADTGFGGNPLITVTTSADLEVLVVFSCTSKPDSSTCTTGTPDTTNGAGCLGTKTVVLSTSCSGTTESGTAYVRVRKKASTNACLLYTLDIGVT